MFKKANPPVRALLSKDAPPGFYALITRTFSIHETLTSCHAVMTFVTKKWLEKCKVGVFCSKITTHYFRDSTKTRDVIRAVARTLIGGGGGGVYSYIHVLPD